MIPLPESVPGLWTPPFRVGVSGGTAREREALREGLTGNPGWRIGREGVIVANPWLFRPDAALILDEGPPPMGGVPGVNLARLPEEERVEAAWDFLLSLPGFARRLCLKAPNRTKFGALWIVTRDRHYKFACTEAARRELAHAVAVMRRNPHGCVPEIHLARADLLVTERYPPLDLTAHGETIAAYLEGNLSRRGEQRTSLWEVAHSPILEETFGREAAYAACRTALQAIPVRPGFAHRDFHADNLLWDATRARMVVVDWGDAREDSCCWFDLLNLVFFRLATLTGMRQLEAVEAWRQAGVALLPAGDPVARLLARYSLEVTPALVAAYLLDYIAVDLNKLPPPERRRKRPKYMNYLAMATTFAEGS
ncbi:MAG: phosphotransferase [Magnetococcales bacterium]|nr:phosphotransferase [Magnetococcales bacterium]